VVPGNGHPGESARCLVRRQTRLRDDHLSLLLHGGRVIVTLLPWFLSASTVYTVLAAGDKKLRAWTIGFINQFVWFAWIVMSASWGLLPMNFVLAAVYVRNYRKWKAEQ
jgi:hypothetical protein